MEEKERIERSEAKPEEMVRVNRILQHPLYESCRNRIEALERERIFCRHDMAHFLDVARIAAILNLEEGLEVEREQIYAAALLHDIGRFLQYENGTPHEAASAQLAPGILADCGFGEAESREITAAIAGHRDWAKAAETDLGSLLYRADKRSRSCFACAAREACSWSREKMNLTLQY